MESTIAGTPAGPSQTMETPVAEETSTAVEMEATAETLATAGGPGASTAVETTEPTAD
jgi:hypothetical protein